MQEDRSDNDILIKEGIPTRSGSNYNLSIKLPTRAWVCASELLHFQLPPIKIFLIILRFKIMQLTKYFNF